MTRVVLKAAVVLALLTLAACSAGSTRAPCPAGKVCLEYGNAAEPASLDPDKINLVNESVIVGDLMVGLVEDGPDGRPMPGIATSWETSPDGLTWTFHLRDALWSDGAPVTAEDFAFAYRRILDPKTASPYAYMLYILKNGEAVASGAAGPSALGVGAPDPRTLVLSLEHPAPYLPQIAKHASMYPIPRQAVARWGDAWAQPGHYVSNGPYIPTAWKLGDHIEAVKNPRFHDAANVCVDRINYYPTTDPVAAERRVRRGELDLNTNILSSRVDYLRQPDQAPELVRIAPYLATVYLPFNGRDVPALKDRRVRQALSMAIDADFITGKLLRAGQSPAHAFVPPQTAGSKPGAKVRWAGWPLERRQAEARRLLAQAGYGPDRPLKISLTFPSSSDALLYGPAVQADWKAVGVQAELIANEPQVAFAALRNRDFQVGLASWVGDYDDPATFLNLMRSGTGAQNYGDYANPAYDALLDQADHERDGDKRAEILSRAEQIMLDDAPVAPLYFTVSRNMVSPRVTGWVDNLADIHRARWLCVKDK
jgi:oligopeptide transport system substrate-binding protein